MELKQYKSHRERWDLIFDKECAPASTARSVLITAKKEHAQASTTRSVSAEGEVVRFSVAQAVDRIGLMLRTVVRTLVVDVRSDNRVARHHILVGSIDVTVILEEVRVLRKSVDVYISLAQCSVFHCFCDYATNICLLRLKAQKFGEVSVGNNLLPLFFAVLLKRFGGDMQMRNLLSEALLPYLLNILIRFVLPARVIEIALGVLVIEPALEPALIDVHKRAVLRDVLLLYHSDFLIQASAEVCFVKSALIHIVVHCLLFRRRNDSNVELGYRRGFFVVCRFAHVVIGMTVM